MDDSLFVRTRGGMLPTHPAREVLPSIEQAVEALRALQDEPPGELPALAGLTCHFRFILSDLEETLFLPELIEDIEMTAPGVTLEVRQFRSDRLKAEPRERHGRFRPGPPAGPVQKRRFAPTGQSGIYLPFTLWQPGAGRRPVPEAVYNLGPCAGRA